VKASGILEETRELCRPPQFVQNRRHPEEVNGGTAIGTTINGGTLQVNGGGTASGTTINTGGFMDFFGTASAGR
jgi:autotransporter passenger strand-loop-strand repeat protein